MADAQAKIRRVMNTSPAHRPRFGQDWPADELESLSACPLCGGPDATVAAQGVEDWSFRAAPGRWTYWRCAGCEGLFLNPRPKREHIGHAYTRYYTHDAGASSSDPETGLKARLRSEAWAVGWGADVAPRLQLPRLLHPLLKPFARKLYPGFVVASLASLPRGKFLDVGCGNGRYLGFAARMGFFVQGIDPDPAAVAAVRAKGLPCERGGFDELDALPSGFQVVLASHTLEHAHDPMQALQRLLNRLAPGGSLILALPNAQSPVFEAFGCHWRGLEAPRHIAIPARQWLMQRLQSQGLRVTPAAVNRPYTWAESEAIAQTQGRAAPPPLASPEPDLIECLVQKI